MGKDAKYRVRLEAEEQERLQGLVDEGRGSKSVRQRARVLLKADQGEGAPGWSDERVAEFAEVSLSTVHRVRQQFVEGGLDAALQRAPSPQRQYRKLDGAGEAKLIATACSQAPEGRSRWTLHLLADKLVELQVVESISHECVRSVLKKRTSTASQAAMGDSSQAECRICGGDGRRFGSVSTTAGSAASAGLSRRTK
jgi:transposase